MAREVDIINQIVTQIAAKADGTGDYTTDLSGTDSVRLGGSFSPDRVPCALVLFDGKVSTQTAGVTALNSYSRTMDVKIAVYGAATTEDPGKLGIAAMVVADDVRRALENDRELTASGSPLVDDLEVDFDAAPMVDAQAVGVAVLGVRLRYRAVAGV